MNSACVPGGKNDPGWDCKAQLLRLLIGTDPEVWACGSSQVPRRRQPSRAGTSWSQWREGKKWGCCHQDIGAPVCPQLVPLEDTSSWLLQNHTADVPPALMKNVASGSQGHPASHTLTAWVSPQPCDVLTGKRRLEAGNRSPPRAILTMGWGLLARDSDTCLRRSTSSPSTLRRRESSRTLTSTCREEGAEPNQRPLGPASAPFFPSSRVSQKEQKEHGLVESANILGSFGP